MYMDKSYFQVWFWNYILGIKEKNIVFVPGPFSKAGGVEQSIFFRLASIYSFIMNLALYIMKIVIIIFKTSLMNYYTIQNVREIYQFSILI